MKVIFFSDIHGNKYALDSFLNNIANYKADKVIFCGDIFGYYYHQNDIINKFRNNNISCILGNHDKFFLDIVDGKLDENVLINKYGNTYKGIKDRIAKENIQFLRTLKKHLILKYNNINIGVFHGSPIKELDGRIYPDTEIEDTSKYECYDYVILGHTHHKMVKKIKNTTIINPGSLGQQRDGRGCSYVILDFNLNCFEFKTVEYNIETLVSDIDFFDKGNEKLKEVLFRKNNKY